jgi:hypothetical protein
MEEKPNVTAEYEALWVTSGAVLRTVTVAEDGNKA